MCGQCAFLKEKYYKEGNGGGKEYYCEYLKEYVCGSCRGCSNYSVLKSIHTTYINPHNINLN